MREPVRGQSVPYDERDQDSGQFTASFDDDEFVAAVREGDLPSTTEVADTVGCEYRTAYERLTRLEEEDTLQRKKVGNSLVWRVNDEAASE